MEKQETFDSLGRKHYYGTKNGELDYEQTPNPRSMSCLRQNNWARDDSRQRMSTESEEPPLPDPILVTQRLEARSQQPTERIIYP